MATAIKRALSASSYGSGVKVVATATPGTTIHIATNSTTSGSFDEVWLYAVNSDIADRNLTIEYGSSTAPDDNITVTIPTKSGLYFVLPGLILQNSKVIKAFCTTANYVTVHGWVNQMTD